IHCGMRKSRDCGYGIWPKDKTNLPIKTKTDKIALVLPNYKTSTERRFHELSYQFFRVCHGRCYRVHSQKMD
ncbi:hypothetical protein, partial [Gemmiger formicilis]|uniref:hypothetical protein n=1 Tax=Gemmiger formicilis TaxID=745368 RepID=UPI0019574121